jgi:hypothetical protein
VFLHRSFASRSFSPAAWLFFDATVQAPAPAIDSSGGGGWRRGEDRLIQQIREEDELVALLIGAMYQTGVFA